MLCLSDRQTIASQCAIAQCPKQPLLNTVYKLTPVKPEDAGVWPSAECGFSSDSWFKLIPDFKENGNLKS